MVYPLIVVICLSLLCGVVARAEDLPPELSGLLNQSAHGSPVAVERVRRYCDAESPVIRGTAQLVIAREHLRMQRHSAALEAARAAMEVLTLDHATGREAALVVAAAHLKLGDASAARLQWAAIQEVDKTSLAAYYASAELGCDALSSNQLDEAESNLGWAMHVFTTVLYARDKDDLGHQRVIDAWDELQRKKKQTKDGEDTSLFDQAQALRAQQDGAGAMVKYTAYLKQQPLGKHHGEAGWAIGECLRLIGKFDSAIEHWQQFINQNPLGAWRGWAWVSIVDACLIDRQEAERAQQVMTQGLQQSEVMVATTARLAPDWQDASRQLVIRSGVFAWLAGNTESAIETLRKAADMPTNAPAVGAPSDGTSATGFGMAFFIDEAIRGRALVPAQVLDAAKPRANLLLHLGLFFLLGGEYATAERAYWKILTSPTERTAAQDAYARYQLGLTAYQQGAYAKQYEWYKDIIERYPSSWITPDAQLCLGVAEYSRMGRPAQAITVFKRVMTQSPGSENAITAEFYIASIYDWTGSFAEAEAAYRQFAQRYPRHHWVAPLNERFLPDMRQRKEQSDAAKTKPPR